MDSNVLDSGEDFERLPCDEAAKTMAVRLIKLGKMTLEEIADCAGISLAEVKELAEQKTV